MINRVVLIGRLTRDPELRTTPSGANVCSYTLAVDRNIKAGQTVNQDCDFINCVTWNKSAENMCQYLSKGSLIGVEGRIQTRSYDNQQGQKVYVTEVLTDSVQFLESKRNAQQNQNYEASQPTNYTSYGYKEHYQEVAKSGQDFKYAGSLTNDDFANYEGLELDPDDLPF